MPIHLTPANPADAPELLEIQRAAFREMYERYRDFNSPYNCTEEKLLYYINDPHGKCYRIVCGDKICGAIWYFVKPSGVYYLGRIFVHPSCQRRGIAKRAIALMEADCPDARIWELDTPTDAAGNHALYEGMGYTRTGEVVRINDRLSLYVYRKELV